jgi:hypothetical protein
VLLADAAALRAGVEVAVSLPQQRSFSAVVRFLASEAARDDIGQV